MTVIFIIVKNYNKEHFDMAVRISELSRDGFIEDKCAEYISYLIKKELLLIDVKRSCFVLTTYGEQIGLC